MTRNTRTLLALPTLLMALAGCRREEAQPAATVAPAASVAPAATASVAPPATVAAPAAPSADTSISAKSVAGTFAAPGTRVVLDADGSYTMHVHAESANAGLASEGTWTLEADGRHVLLDPSSKAEPDHRYALVSLDELRPDAGGASLQREGAH